MNTAFFPRSQTVRTVWLSDVHLGNKDCRAEYLLDFLQRVDCETLYLLGDIVDFWALKRQFIWPSAHYDVLRAIMHKAKHGTRVVYVPGNHDEAMREFVGHSFGSAAFGLVEIREDAVHVTADGRRLLLLHGDCLDMHVQLDFIACHFGDLLYDLLMWMHRWCHRARRFFNLPYWSLAAHIKKQFRNARAAILAYERAAVAEAARRGLDGVVCGHIHHPELTHHDGLLYCNDGDWVESCTALVERRTGELEILHWSNLYQSVKQMQSSANDALSPGIVARAEA